MHGREQHVWVGTRLDRDAFQQATIFSFGMKKKEREREASWAWYTLEMTAQDLLSLYNLRMADCIILFRPSLWGTLLLV